MASLPITGAARFAASPARQATAQTRRYDYIDILRGLAILGVIAVHAHQPIAGLQPLTAWVFNYGQMGVQLFFVASAMTLCLSMQSRNDPSIVNFYVRRLFRVAPLYYVGIALYLAWGTAKNWVLAGHAVPPPQYDVAGILSNVLFVHAFYAPANNNIVPGGWSIATEMSFYLVFPVLYWMQRRLTDRAYLLFAAACLAACFALEYLALTLTHRGPDNAEIIYFSLVNQLGAFLVGIQAYRRLDRVRLRPFHFAAAIALVVASGALLNGAWQTGFNGFLLPLLAASAFMVLALRLSTVRAIEGRGALALKRIGELSFSMYVLHFCIVEIAYFVLKRSLFHVVQQPELQLAALVCVVVAASWAGAAFTHRVIERPGIALGRRFLRRVA